MSMLQSFEFLMVPFFTGMWMNATAHVLPWYHAWALVIVALFQRIYFQAGGAITDPTAWWFVYWWIAVCGTGLSVVFQWVVTSPHLLRERAGWATMDVLVFPVSTVAYAFTFAFYETYPIPSSPWGLLITMGVSTLVIVFVWWWTSGEAYVTAEYGRAVTGFFVLWMLLNVAMCAFQFIAYQVTEVYTSFITAGCALGLLLVGAGIYVCCVGAPRQLPAPGVYYYAGK